MTTPRRNRVDLHCHTARSDGLLEPVELQAEMQQWGMGLVAITDHDTLDAFRDLRAAGLTGVPEARVDALGGTWYAVPPAGPRIIAGVEINSVSQAPASEAEEEELHILGLGVDPDDPAFEAVLARQRSRRGERIGLIAERLRKLGMPVDEPLAAILGPGVEAPGRPHLARALVDAGYAADVDDAMVRLLSHGAPAYVPRQGLGPRDAIEAIEAAGGIASLAHYPSAPDRATLIARLREWGLRGLEVHYAGFDPHTVERMAAFANAQELLPTGGSDFHGDTWTYAEAQAATDVPDEVGVRLLAVLALD
jgi:predicted metal-dependent phosphoesterase TrpH